MKNVEKASIIVKKKEMIILIILMVIQKGKNIQTTRITLTKIIGIIITISLVMNLIIIMIRTIN